MPESFINLLCRRWRQKWLAADKEFLWCIFGDIDVYIYFLARVDSEGFGSVFHLPLLRNQGQGKRSYVFHFLNFSQNFHFHGTFNSLLSSPFCLSFPFLCFPSCISLFSYFLPYPFLTLHPPSHSYPPSLSFQPSPTLPHVEKMVLRLGNRIVLCTPDPHSPWTVPFLF